MINVTQKDYDIVKQRFQTRYIRLNILDFQYQKIDEISGNLIDGSFNVDANSDVRRSCNVSLVVYGKDAYKLSISPTSEIFLDKYIQPLIGIENNRTGDVQWYSQGIYLINRPTWDWDAQTNTLKFDGVDLMGRMTGIRNGQLEGIPTVVKAGSSVRDAIIAAINMAGFTDYVVDECRLSDGTIQPVPNDITIEQGGTIYDLLSQLRDILPSYQIYFDINGVFHYERIPDGTGDPILLDDYLIGDVLISESINSDFEAVKNYIEVYGRSHTIQNYASVATVNDNIINLTIESLSDVGINESDMIGFTLGENATGNISLNVNATGEKNLVDGSGDGILSLNKDEYYVAVYQSNNTWLFLGHQQAKAIAYDDNPSSPFYINGPVGIIRHVCYGGEYDNIQSDELAKERADYELYLRDRLQDTISLYVIPIPWLDVNVLIRHTAKDDTEAKIYMIQSIQCNIGSGETMSIIANQYYPKDDSGNYEYFIVENGNVYTVVENEPFSVIKGAN